MLFVFGVGLFGGTTLISQILQPLYGYRATDAGLVLGPGTFVISLLAPVGAQLIQRRPVHPRVLIAIGLATAVAAMWYYSAFNLATDYGTLRLPGRYKDLDTASFSCP